MMLNQAVYMKMMVKRPGRDTGMFESEMDLSYHLRYKVRPCRPETGRVPDHEMLDLLAPILVA